METTEVTAPVTRSGALAQMRPHHRRGPAKGADEWTPNTQAGARACPSEKRNPDLAVWRAVERVPGPFGTMPVNLAAWLICRPGVIRAAEAEQPEQSKAPKTCRLLPQDGARRTLQRRD